MKLLLQCSLIGVAGFCGAIVRFLVAMLIGQIANTSFPVGTFIINVTGSFFLGWFLTVAGERAMVSETTRLMIATGFVGAYTTFSTFTYESNALVERGSLVYAGLNLIGSLVIGLLAVRLGIALARR